MARRLSKLKIAAFFAALAEANPAPKGELDYINEYTLLVAVVLSAQATDVGVNKATGPLFAKVKTPQQMLALGEDGLIRHIKSIGLFRNKAKYIIGLSNMLIEKFDGSVPRTRDALVELPGVGRKTANVVLNIAFGEPTIAVDTHLFRVSNRTGVAPAKTPLAVEQELLKSVPPEYLRHAHHWLILHGRYVCTARKPKCTDCVVREICSWKEKTV